jgi:CubicO group peptidase (beta-lactamase class C family)/outer membrane lipoprotein-sorting protein
MKQVKLFLILSMIFSLSGALSAQTADEIIAKNIETRGGVRQLSSIKTLKYTGTFKEEGLNAKLTLFFKSPNKVLFHLGLGNLDARIGYDGRTMWKQFPGRTPGQQPKSSDKLVAVFAEYQEFLMAYSEKDCEFEMVGRENFEGAEVYKIKVTPEYGQIIHLLIDRNNHTVSCMFFENPAGSRYSFYLRDYREADGIVLPCSIDAEKSNGEITRLSFENIEKNVEIDETLFSLPISRFSQKAQSQAEDPAPHEYSYRIPEQTDDGWLTASLTDVGMETEPLVDLMDQLLNRSDHFTHSVLVIKNGKLVFEEYFSGSDLVVNEDTLTKLVLPGGKYQTKEVAFDRDTLHFQASVTKSFTSLLLGIALDKQLIRGVHEKMFSFFPEYSALDSGLKSDITIKHMLSMSSGIPWSESYPFNDSRNYIYQLLAADDPLEYVLDLKLFTTPGRRFNYNSGTTVLLGDIIRRTAKASVENFAEKHLFAPLGIKKFRMVNLPNAKEVFFGSSGLYLRPRDMAKIGQLYLQNGLWENKRIVSSKWVRESVEQSIGFPPSHALQHFAESYGYQWWLGTYYTKNAKAYMAAGFGGQFIVVFPELEMVVVLTGGNWYDRSPFLTYDFAINNYILTAIK